MFSVEFCAFLAVGGRFLFESTADREEYHGFTLAARAQLLKDLPCRLMYETQDEWKARQPTTKAKAPPRIYVDQVSVWCPVPANILKKYQC